MDLNEQAISAASTAKQIVLLILDGASDLTRINGKTPLQTAHVPTLDLIASRGTCGLMETLYDDLSKGSIVAQLGMLGFDPHIYYPNGRASCEALALGVRLEPGDLAFRANLIQERDGFLVSYNAGYIKSDHALPLIGLLRRELSAQFPEFEIHHNSDFRNTLVMRGASIAPSDLICAEPHEEVNQRFDFSNLIRARRSEVVHVANRINSYIEATRGLLAGCEASAIFPWSCSSAILLPKFSLLADGNCTFLGHMDFLHGIASACGVGFIKIGNGDWDTDYAGKGAATVDRLRRGDRFVLCHVNAPDEASHMGDFAKKVYSLEQIDEHIAKPIVEYFESSPESLGAFAIAPDHYTNTFFEGKRQIRSDVHSKDLVPFAVWSSSDPDEVRQFDEDSVSQSGRYSRTPINHLEFLPMVSGHR